MRNVSRGRFKRLQRIGAYLLHNLPDAGLTIITDHGMGIYSAYLHLSKVLVREGQAVLKGDEIGRAGASGDYVLAPHLHFSIKIRGASVDPKKFIGIINRFFNVVK